MFTVKFNDYKRNFSPENTFTGNVYWVLKVTNANPLLEIDFAMSNLLKYIIYAFIESIAKKKM